MTPPETAPMREDVTQAKKYRKTALIEASQWFKDGDHPAVIMKTAPNRYADAGIPWCPTLEGGHVVTPGDWIATGAQGDHWPIKHDVFTATYEPADIARSDTAKLTETTEDKIADMIAFGASETAPYLYPNADQQTAREAYCEGAAQGARALLRWQNERAARADAAHNLSDYIDGYEDALEVAARPDAGDEVERVARADAVKVAIGLMDEEMALFRKHGDIMFRRGALCAEVMAERLGKLAAMREGVDRGMVLMPREPDAAMISVAKSEFLHAPRAQDISATIRAAYGAMIAYRLSGKG